MHGESLFRPAHAEHAFKDRAERGENAGIVDKAVFEDFRGVGMVAFSAISRAQAGVFLQSAPHFEELPVRLFVAAVVVQAGGHLVAPVHVEVAVVSLVVGRVVIGISAGEADGSIVADEIGVVAPFGKPLRLFAGGEAARLMGVVREESGDNPPPCPCTRSCCDFHQGRETCPISRPTNGSG